MTYMVINIKMLQFLCSYEKLVTRFRDKFGSFWTIYGYFHCFGLNWGYLRDFRGSLIILEVSKVF